MTHGASRSVRSSSRFDQGFIGYGSSDGHDFSRFRRSGSTVWIAIVIFIERLASRLIGTVGSSSNGRQKSSTLIAGRSRSDGHDAIDLSLTLAKLPERSILIQRWRCSAILEHNKGNMWIHLMQRSPSDGGHPIGRWIASNEEPRSTRDCGPISARLWLLHYRIKNNPSHCIGQRSLEHQNHDRRPIVARSSRSWPDRGAIVVLLEANRGSFGLKLKPYSAWD